MRARSANQSGAVIPVEDAGSSSAAGAAPDSSRRSASLDFLRGSAAFAVAIPHFFIISSATSPHWEIVAVLAVEIFFVLSGFVLAPQILHCVQQASRDLRVFLIRRWMRTVPPYLLALAAMSTVAEPVLAPDFVRYVAYAQNFFSQHNVKDYFPVAWSLSVEEWFYVLFPAALLAAARWFKRTEDRFIVQAALGFIVVVTLARVLFANYDNWGEDVRRVVVFRIDSIAYGFLLYMGLHRSGYANWLRDTSRDVFVALLLLLIATTMTAAVAFRVASAAAVDVWSMHLFPFVAAALGSLTILAFYRLGAVFDRCPIAVRLGLFLGQISYSVYLFHFIWVLLLKPYEPNISLGRLAAYVGAVVIGSTLLYYSFERPILAARPSYKTKPVVSDVGGPSRV